MPAKTTVIKSVVTKNRAKVIIPIDDLLQLLASRGWAKPLDGTMNVSLDVSSGTITIVHESDSKSEGDAEMEEIALFPREQIPLYVLAGPTEYTCQEPDCQGHEIQKATFKGSGKQFQICTNCGTMYLRAWDMPPYYTEADDSAGDDPSPEDESELDTENDPRED